jgi:hypothetical protein
MCGHKGEDVREHGGSNIMRNFILCSDDQIKEDEKGKKCHTHGEVRNA